MNLPNTRAQSLPERQSCWWPVALTRQLKPGRPLGVVACHNPLVLFRDVSGQAVALPDRCPHRHAPLSAGEVHKGEIQCPYHGWRFNAAGQCTRVAGSEDCATSKSLLASWFCREAGGLVWVNQSTDTAPITGSIDGLGREPDCDSFWLTARLNAEILDVAENFLDGYHTHFVHKGWIRRDSKRQQLLARRRPLVDGIEVEYQGESGQNGWLSRLLEPQRGLSWGRFRWPNLAEVEYRDRRQRLSFAASVWLNPLDSGRLEVFARVSTRRGFWPALPKRWLLTALFTPILRQDKDIIERCWHNRQRFEQILPPLDAPHDLMGPALRQLLDQGSVEEITEKTLHLRL